MIPRLPPFRRAIGRQGFTLVEIVITIILLGAVAGVLLPFFNAIIHSPDPVMRERAISLGQAMMDEIMAKRWDENSPIGGGPLITGETPPASGTSCTPEPYACTGNRLYCYICRNPNYLPGTASAILGSDTENRPDYDDVDDYNGINETSTFTDQNGTTFQLPDYSRTVTVRYIVSNSDPITKDTDNAGGNTTDTKLVVVTVTSPLGETFNFVAVACNF